MDDDFTDLRNRQTRTEHHVTDLQNEVKREAKARAGMNEKLDDILIKVRAHEKSLSALRQDQAAQGKTLESLKTDIAVLKTDVAVLKTDMGDVKGHLVTVKAGVHAILDLLDANLGKSGDD